MLNQRLRSALDALGLTLYGASQLIGAETGQPLKTVHARLSRYVGDNPPETIAHLEKSLEALGLELIIRPLPAFKNDYPNLED